MRCRICGEGELTEHEEELSVACLGVTGHIPSRYSVCGACGSEQADPVQVKANKMAMMGFRKKVEQSTEMDTPLMPV